jgi:hypothetical protein
VEKEELQSVDLKKESKDMKIGKKTFRNQRNKVGMEDGGKLQTFR